ncbi:hypothetical protein Peur_000124 [Populus x canadensis]
MASHILLVIASFLAIICALPTASDPSPLQDSCVADPTSSVDSMYLPTHQIPLDSWARIGSRGLCTRSQSPGLIPISDLFATNPSNIPDDILAKAFPAG